MSSFFYRIGRRDTAAGIEGAAMPFRRNGAERRNPGKPVWGCRKSDRLLRHPQAALLKTCNGKIRRSRLQYYRIGIV